MRPRWRWPRGASAWVEQRAERRPAPLQLELARLATVVISGRRGELQLKVRQVV